MIPEHPYFEEYLDFTYSSFGKPEIDDTSIRVPVRHLLVLKGFPGYDDEVNHEQAILVFENVASSERNVSAYQSPTAKSPEKKYQLNDGPFNDVSKPLFTFQLFGPSYDLNAWVYWNIVAASVYVQAANKTK